MSRGTASGVATPPAAPLLGVASYNVHRCVGVDGRDDPERVAAVIRELAVDVVAVQEIEARTAAHGIDQIDYMARTLGLTAVRAPTLLRYRGQYGNALLTGRPVVAVRRIDLTVAGREARGALDVDLAIEGGVLRVVTAHLGLRAGERRVQARALVRALGEDARGPLVVLGDFNEWRPVGGALRPLIVLLGRAPVRRTFPSWRPLVALDRIWVRPRHALAEVRVHTSTTARVASDHLPVRAALRLAGDPLSAPPL